jgi:tripartite-type tricarboxylate transporter receptor subunit TctC
VLIEKLSVAIAEAVKSPDVSDKLASVGNILRGSSSAEAQAFIDAESKRWGQIIRAAGIALE